MLVQNVKLEKKMRILDAGCGPGCAVHISKICRFSRVDGVDISEKMLKLPKRKKLYTRLF